MADIIKTDAVSGEFSSQPPGIVGSCPATNKMAIYPVRYAIDESPTKKGAAQGPHPIPKDWQWTKGTQQKTLPDLKTRSYCMRQLRDGWLYVYDLQAQELHEYQIEGKNLTFKGAFQKNTAEKTKKQQANTKANPDRPEIDQSRPFLLYSKDKRLYLNYSPVRCTDRIKQQLTQSTAFTKWVRQISLSMYCHEAETKGIHELGKYVADITPAAGFADSTTAPFTSTNVSTVPRPNTPAEEKYAVKPVINELQIRSPIEAERVIGIFVALDDPLGIVDDLTMNLIGRWGEIALFESKRRRKLDIARQCLQLLDDQDKKQQINTFIPKRLQKDQIQYYACLQDLTKLLESQGDSPEPRAPYILDEFDHIAYDKNALHQQYMAFRKKWSYAPEQYDPAREKETEYNYEESTVEGALHLTPDGLVTLSERWREKYKNWKEAKIWRDDVRFEEMLDYHQQYFKDKQQLENHLKRHEDDLLVWTNQLGDNIESVFYDPVDKDQLQDMAETTEAITSYLSQTDTGKAWLRKQVTSQQNFLTLANFGFSKEYYQFLVEQLQKIDKLGDQEIAQAVQDNTPNILAGSLSPAISFFQVLKGKDTANSAINRSNEIVGFLSLDAVKNSSQFQALSKVAQSIFSNLCDLTLTPTGKVLGNIANSLLDVLDETSLLAYKAAVAVINKGPQGEVLFLTRNQHFKTDVKQWVADIKATQNLIEKALDKTEIERLNKILREFQGNPPAKWYIEIGANYEKVPYLNYRSLQNSLLNGVEGLIGQEQLKSWSDSVKGSALPLIVSMANIYNIFVTKQQLQEQGYSEQWRLNMVAAVGYATSSTMAIWVMPMAEACKPLEGVSKVGLVNRTTEFTKTAIRHWTPGETNLIAASKQLSNQFAAMSFVAAFAAAHEAWGVYQYEFDSTDAMDKVVWTSLKLGALGAMALSASVQFLLSILARFFAMGWFALNPFFVYVGLIAGVVYFVSSLYVKYYTRDGLRLWLHRCTWGRDPENFWQTQENGETLEYHALYKIILSPSIIVQGITDTHVIIDEDKYKTGKVSGSTHFSLNSFWINITLPEQIATKDIQVDMLLVDPYTQQPIYQNQFSFYSQLKTHGYWAAPLQDTNELVLPQTPLKTIQPDYSYSAEERQRRFRVWLDLKGLPLAPRPVNKVLPYVILEMKFTYPNSAFFYEETNTLNKSYIFRLEAEALTAFQSAKLVSDDYHRKGLPDNLYLGNKLASNCTQIITVPALTLAKKDDK